MKKGLDIKILTGSEVNDRALRDITHNDLHDISADVISQNLSDRKKLEEMLEASEKKYRTFFENSLDAILITSQDGAIHSANPAACKMLGWDENEICGLGREGLVEQTTQLTLALRRRKESGKFFGELTLIKKDGTRFPVELSSSVFTDSDGRELTMMIARDITERKKTERDLYEEGEKNRLFMENSGLGIGYYDTDGTILMFNKEALKNFEGSKVDFIGKNLKDVFGKEKGDFFIRRLKQAAKSERSLQFEDKVELNGNPEWFMSTHIRILNKNGDVDGIQVIANNITQSKIAENTILENNANLIAILENNRDMIASRDKNNCLVVFNTPFRNIIRTLYGTEAVTGLNTLKYFDEKEEKRWIGIFNDILTGNTYRSEFKWDFGNGDIRYYDISISPIIKNDEIIGTLEINKDITESKKAEEKIRAGSLYARNIIEASLDLLVTISKDGKITDVNLATEQITGLNRERLIGTDFADYFTKPDKAKEGYKTVFKYGTIMNYPLSIRSTNGRKIDVLYNATLFKNEEGEVQGVFAAARDITDRKKMESELRNSKKLLEKLNQHLFDVRESERAQIALNLHDDLGQKLTAINLDIAWLKSRIGVQSKTVQEKFEGMSLMIKETIESIKETSSFLRPAILFDLGLVPAIKSQLTNFEKQTGIKCHFNYKPEEFVLEDQLALILYRIFQESLTNIARHSGASAMELNLRRLKDAIEMIIKDDGIGIDNYKVNSLTSMGIQGIKERVKSAHGKVSIKGEKGSGTTIKVSIPFKKGKHD